MRPAQGVLGPFLSCEGLAGRRTVKALLVSYTVKQRRLGALWDSVHLSAFDGFRYALPILQTRASCNLACNPMQSRTSRTRRCGINNASG